MKAKYLFSALILTVGLATGGAAGQTTAPSPQSVDAHRLEVSEELSESLANDLLELSVITKNRDREQTALFFPEELTADPFPSEPANTKPEVKWVLSHGWTAPVATSSLQPAKIKAAKFLDGWSAFLDHFSEVEDARFKVKVSSFDDSAQAIIGAEVPTAVPGATGHAPETLAGNTN